MAVPSRRDGETILADWFNALADEIISSGTGVVLGGYLTPITITAASVLPNSAAEISTVIFVKGDTGGSTVGIDPFLTAGTIEGQRITIVATSDADFLVINSDSILSLESTYLMKDKHVLSLLWDGNTWTETSRSHQGAETAIVYTDSAGASYGATAAPVFDGDLAKTVSEITLNFAYLLNTPIDIPIGNIKVYFDGKLLPKYNAGIIPSGDFFKEVTTTTFRLSEDYSLHHLLIQVIK
jgi:hypothetical protein